MSQKIKLSKALVLRRSKFSKTGWDWFIKNAEEAIALRNEARRNKQDLHIKCIYCDQPARVHDSYESNSPEKHFEHKEENKNCKGGI